MIKGKNESNEIVCAPKFLKIKKDISLKIVKFRVDKVIQADIARFQPTGVNLLCY